MHTVMDATTMPITGDQKKPHVVFMPFPAQSHIKCMLKLARLLHHKGLHITFINTESNHKCLLKHGGADEVPGFQFKAIPDGHPDDETQPIKSTEENITYLLTHFVDDFLDILTGLEVPPTCVICDGFMTVVGTIYAAEKLKIPVFLYWTLAACGFMAYYHIKGLFDKGLLPFKDESYLTNGYTDTLIAIPGMEQVRIKDLPNDIFTTKQDDLSLHWIVESARKADIVSHMIIHSFDELEAHLIKEIKSLFPHTYTYTVGPQQLLLNHITEKEAKKSNVNGHSLWKEEPECVQWLQSKEENSVLYINFGSLAVMSIQDLVEFGWGVVNSNHYFLWIIRADLVDGKHAAFPQELNDMIKERGFVASWCSQEDVLNHPSVGGFLTHGGWGSVIESLSAGVPMVCRPFIHEQQVNCRQMCQEWEVGMEIEGDVKRDEVENHVRELMEGIKGKKMRNKAMEWKKVAEIATNSNGSSSLNVEELAKDIMMLSRN